MKRLVHLAFLVYFAVALSACGGKDTPPPTAPPADSTGGSSGSSGNSGSSSTDPGKNFVDVDRFPLNRLISGGVAKDGIPALTDPDFVTPGSGDAGYLRDEDLVLGVHLNGVARAYPHNIGWYHEIVNDAIGGQHIVVTLCPLTGTGLVFDGRGDGDDRIAMGVSGLLFNNNLVMYDRRDNESLYPQMIHKGISGFRLGAELTLLPVVETTWGYWKRLFPGTWVISGNSAGTYSMGRYRDYPYTGYRQLHSGPMFPLFPEPNNNPILRNFPLKEMVLGVRFDRRAKAYPFSQMGGDQAVINDTFAGEDLLIVYYADARLALPFLRRLGSQTFTFEQIPSGDSRFPFLMRDRETGSTWNLLGQAVAGEMRGRQLRQLAAHNAFWFAWATFWQDTEVYSP